MRIGAAPKRNHADVGLVQEKVEISALDDDDGARQSRNYRQ